MTDVPLGSRVSRLEWLATPDKYAGPKLFDDLAKARAHGPSSIITVELEVTTPEGRAVSLSGGVSTVDSMFRDTEWQDVGVLPERDARLTAVESAGRHLVFTNPGGGRWVLWNR